MANDVFRKRIRDLRKKNSLTMDQLAALLKTSKSRISMWENNGTVPRKDMLIKLSEYYGVSIDYLLGNDLHANIQSENKKLSYLQRNLGKLNEHELEQAEGMLKAVFKDIFEDEEGEYDGI